MNAVYLIVGFGYFWSMVVLLSLIVAVMFVRVIMAQRKRQERASTPTVHATFVFGAEKKEEDKPREEASEPSQSGGSS